MTLALIVAAFLLLRFAPAHETSTREAALPLRHAAREVNRYIVVTGLCVGALTWLLDADPPLVYGLLAFLLNYIPNLGRRRFQLIRAPTEQPGVATKVPVPRRSSGLARSPHNTRVASMTPSGLSDTIYYTSITIALQRSWNEFCIDIDYERARGAQQQ